jgi:transposase
LGWRIGGRASLIAAWCSDLVPVDSIFALLAGHGDRIVGVEDFAECCCERQGRPSIPPSLLAKVLLLAYREGLCDERAMEAVRVDLRWRVALDLSIDHPGFHPTSLVRYRARLLLHGRERLIFERSLELAAELGVIEGAAEQIVDSTAMLGAAAVQDTATLVRSGVRKLLDAVGASDEGAAEELASGLCFGCSRPREKPAGDWEDRASRGALLAEVARDAVRARRRMRSSRPRPRSPRRRSLCARSSARSSRAQTTRSHARAEVAGRGRSSPPTTPRCATVARPPLHRLQAPRRGGGPGADPDLDHALAGERARRPPGGSAGRPAAQEAAAPRG